MTKRLRHGVIFLALFELTVWVVEIVQAEHIPWARISSCLPFICLFLIFQYIIIELHRAALINLSSSARFLVTSLTLVDVIGALSLVFVDIYRKAFLGLYMVEAVGIALLTVMLLIISVSSSILQQPQNNIFYQ